jgi:hypothetical protein
MNRVKACKRSFRFKITSLSSKQMASVRSSIVLPEPLRAALDIRSRCGTCPAAVESQLAKIPYFRPKGPKSNPVPVPTSGFQMARMPMGRSSGPQTQVRPPVSSSSNRFQCLRECAPPEGWRTHAASTPAASPIASEPVDDGFEKWNNRKKRRDPIQHVPSTLSVSSEPVVPSEAPSQNAWRPTKLKGMETSLESVEDRILGKVRGKINKIGESTYGATKAFMQQILDSGEVEFLNEFMKFVFQKAATEPSFCGLYARLLHELADEFSHLRTEMQKLFRDYTFIFTETEKTPDVGTADYTAFVESQERKKFRRGYSQFVAELAKQGEVNEEDFRSLVENIVTSIRNVYMVPENTLLCEEYVDCLSKMCVAGASLLKRTEWMKVCLGRLREIAELPKASSPGLTNKARFALMDLLDFAKAGWRK